MFLVARDVKRELRPFPLQKNWFWTWKLCLEDGNLRILGDQTNVIGFSCRRHLDSGTQMGDLANLGIVELLRALKLMDASGIEFEVYSVATSNSPPEV